MNDDGCVLIIKYLNEIKLIVSKIQIKPEEEKIESKIRNSYFICGDLLLVKMRIKIINSYCTGKYVYILLDSKNKDLLYDDKFIAEIDMRYYGRNGYSHITIKSTKNGDLLSKKYEKKYPPVNPKYKRYILKNSNPFDFRDINMIASVNRRKSVRNKSGITGVYLDNKGNWTTSIKHNRKRKTQSFSIKIYGNKKAKMMAEQMRLKWEKEILDGIL